MPGASHQDDAASRPHVALYADHLHAERIDAAPLENSQTVTAHPRADLRERQPTIARHGYGGRVGRQRTS